MPTENEQKNDLFMYYESALYQLNAFTIFLIFFFHDETFKCKSIVGFYDFSRMEHIACARKLGKNLITTSNSNSFFITSL
jgi:hypothetical protein